MARARSRKSKTSERGGTLRFLLIILLAAWLFRSLVLAPFSIPTGSMLPTLYIGDYLLVAKWPYGYSRFSFPFQFPPFRGRLLPNTPERGDIVIFRPPGEPQDFVKRVIGIPGDSVEVRDGALILNGQPVPRGDMEPVAVPVSPNSPCRVARGATAMIRRASSGEACIYPTYHETLPGGASYRIIDQVDSTLADNFPATIVPEGKVFLMGDNRDDSLDSRFSQAEGGVGLVPIGHLVGRASILFWSIDGSASYVEPWTWFSALRGERLGKTFEDEQ